MLQVEPTGKLLGRVITTHVDVVPGALSSSLYDWGLLVLLPH
jgi:hypothetical protein